MRWVLTGPQIIETADDMSREQVITELIRQNVLRGAADMFNLEPIEQTVESSTTIYDECNAPNGAAEEVRNEGGPTEDTAEN